MNAASKGKTEPGKRRRAGSARADNRPGPSVCPPTCCQPPCDRLCKCFSCNQTGLKLACLVAGQYEVGPKVVGQNVVGIVAVGGRTDTSAVGRCRGGGRSCGQATQPSSAVWEDAAAREQSNLPINRYGDAPGPGIQTLANHDLVMPRARASKPSPPPPSVLPAKLTPSGRQSSCP